MKFIESDETSNSYYMGLLILTFQIYKVNALGLLCENFSNLWCGGAVVQLGGVK